MSTSNSDACLSKAQMKKSAMHKLNKINVKDYIEPSN